MEILKNFLTKYGFFILGGAVGAMVHRLRKKMSLVRFLNFLIIAMVTALSAGIISKEVFELSDVLCYVICGIFGAFSENILNELEEFISSLSEIAKQKLGYEDHKKNIRDDEN